MALDVYVGTLTRFYRGEWENPGQRLAREQGTQYHLIHAGGEPEPHPSVEEIRKAISTWCEALSNALQSHNCGQITLDEAEDRPYFTERPGWHGYSGMLVWAAHAEHPDLPMPKELPKSRMDDAAFARSSNREFPSKYGTILQPTLWLPAEFPFFFEGETLHSDKSCIGSVFTLRRQIEELLDLTGPQLFEQAQRQQRAHAAAPKRSWLGRLLSRSAEENKPLPPGVAESAEYGLEIFRDLAVKACEHRLPMILSY
jgi:hypothetical protein